MRHEVVTEANIQGRIKNIHHGKSIMEMVMAEVVAMIKALRIWVMQGEVSITKKVGRGEAIPMGIAGS
jgi:hypothetical protein